MTKEMEERLARANTLREEERYGESAKEYMECLLDCVKENDAEGIIHALGGQSLVCKIQARRDGKSLWKKLTVAFAKECYQVAEDNKEGLDGRVLAIAYRCWGDALLMDGQTSESLPHFEKALEVSTANRCEKGSLKAHIGWVKYLLGDTGAAIDTIKEAIEDIRTGDMTQYAPRVWETGAMNSLAKIYAKENKKEEALKIIEETIQIAEQYNLSIRLREAKEIKEKIEQGRMDFGV